MLKASIIGVISALSFILSSSSLVTEKMKIISFEEFEAMVEQPSDKIRIYNFWATWCAPCIKEMPHFQSISEEKDYELFFISLDDGRKPERVENFITKRNITAPVFLLDDIDYNRWIGKVDENWSGAIPATLFVDSAGNRYFHEGEMSEDELRNFTTKLK